MQKWFVAWLQVVEHLPSKQETLRSNPAQFKKKKKSYQKSGSNGHWQLDLYSSLCGCSVFVTEGNTGLGLAHLKTGEKSGSPF
jgi:hypothetical protein